MFESLRKLLSKKVAAHEKIRPEIVLDENERDSVRIRTSKGREISFYFRPHHDDFNNWDQFLALSPEEKKTSREYRDYVQAYPVLSHEHMEKSSNFWGNQSADAFIGREELMKEWDVSDREVEEIFDLADKSLTEMYARRDKSI